MRLNPNYICLDFEKGLINAAKNQFRKAKLFGCLFHWMQSIRRCMISLGVKKDQVSYSTTKNVLDILTMIPKNEIVKKGAPHAKHDIESMGLTSEDRQKWSTFWTCFSKFWLSSSFFIGLWNIADNNDEENEIHSRVNNGLER